MRRQKIRRIIAIAFRGATALNRTFAIALCLYLSLSLVSRSRAQYMAVGAPEPIPVGDLDAMQDMLAQATPAQKIDLLTRLGVNSASAKAAIDELYDNKIQIRPLRFKEKTPYAAVYVPGFRGCFLFLLNESAQPHQPRWRVSDSSILDGWHGIPVFETIPLRHSDQDDLVFHGVNEGHGSGYAADQTQVFSVTAGKLVQVLSTEDYRYEDILGDGQQEEVAVEQRSTFLRFPDRAYEETRTTSENYVLKKVERRYWRWSDEQRKFVPGPFATVDEPPS